MKGRMHNQSGKSLAYSAACERNKQPIRDVLAHFLPTEGTVFEVGSGSGQHVVYFAHEFDHLKWQPSDTGVYLPGLKIRLEHEAPSNVLAPLEVDVRDERWVDMPVQGVFTANTLHYMSVECGAQFFSGATTL